MKTERYILELSENAAYLFSVWLEDNFESDSDYAGLVVAQTCDICCGLFTDYDHHGHVGAGGW